MRSEEAFCLRFDASDIGHWASRCDAASDSLIENEVAPRIQAAGYVSKPDFLTLCDWKSPRIRRHAEKNTEEFVKGVTRTAFSLTDERFSIGVLMLLQGVGYPAASVILHFGSRDPYPIIDVRALWSLGVEKPPNQYTFEFWWAYVTYCRQLATRCGADMRTLDRALWQYSKEHQGKE